MRAPCCHTCWPAYTCVHELLASDCLCKRFMVDSHRCWSTHICVNNARASIALNFFCHASAQYLFAMGDYGTLLAAACALKYLHVTWCLVTNMNKGYLFLPYADI